MLVGDCRLRCGLRLRARQVVATYRLTSKDAGERFRGVRGGHGGRIHRTASHAGCLHSAPLVRLRIVSRCLPHPTVFVLSNRSSTTVRQSSFVRYSTPSTNSYRYYYVVILSLLLWAYDASTCSASICRWLYHQHTCTISYLCCYY